MNLNNFILDKEMSGGRSYRKPISSSRSRYPSKSYSFKKPSSSTMR